MAVKIITNACISGAIMGIMDARQVNSAAPTAYATPALIAKAIGNQCVTANAALGAPMADADNTEIGFLVMGCARAVVSGWFLNDQTATDYAAIANQIVAMAKQTVAQLV